MRATEAGFPREKRLTQSREFGRVFGDARRSSDRYFTMLTRPNELTVPRLGLTISRRAAKRAVDRNRLKRLAREVFRRRNLPSWDFIVMARPSASRAESRLLRDSLDAHFDRLTERTAERRDG